MLHKTKQNLCLAEGPSVKIHVDGFVKNKISTQTKVHCVGTHPYETVWLGRGLNPNKLAYNSSLLDGCLY